MPTVTTLSGQTLHCTEDELKNAQRVQLFRFKDDPDAELFVVVEPESD